VDNWETLITALSFIPLLLCAGAWKSAKCHPLSITPGSIYVPSLTTYLPSDLIRLSQLHCSVAMHTFASPTNINIANPGKYTKKSSRSHIDACISIIFILSISCLESPTIWHPRICCLRWYTAFEMWWHTRRNQISSSNSRAIPLPTLWITPGL